MSNFDWTDKTSVKWFIMLPSGHEGPYSMESILSRKLPLHTKIWAEGLADPLEIKEAINRSFAAPEIDEDDLPPPLPPLPIDEEDEALPPNPGEEPVLSDGVRHDDTYENFDRSPAPKARSKMAGFLAGGLLISVFALYQWVDSQKEFNLRRADRMSPELFARIKRDFKFGGWNNKIFFKEYVPADMSHIWLVNGGFQECSVEALFSSVPGKLLAVKDEPVSFKSQAKLKNHIAEFSNFEFSSGNKILPGLYEVDLKATDCSWGSLAAKLGNFFQSPQPNYHAKMKIVLFHKGSADFNLVLDSLIRKKLDLEIKNQNQEELFWQDQQQKLNTLMQLTLQIEQTFVEFTDLPPQNFKANLKAMVDKYTAESGGMLSEFVIQNEKFFKELNEAELSDMTKKRTYEDIIKLTSKSIGFQSMKIIEELQSWKAPTKEDMGRMKAKVKHNFSVLKDALNLRLIQITEDRAGTAAPAETAPAGAN